MHLNVDDTVMCLFVCFAIINRTMACSSKTPHISVSSQTVIVSLCTVTVVKQIIGMCMKHLIIFVCNLKLFHLHYGILTKTKALLDKSNVNTCLCFCISKIKPQNFAIDRVCCLSGEFRTGFHRAFVFYAACYEPGSKIVFPWKAHHKLKCMLRL